MEQVLHKLAHQLDSLDEASLSALWEKYAHQVRNFEPSQRWQEAVLVFSFIQAKRWKNHLFNSKWAARSRTDFPESQVSGPFFSLENANPSPPKRASVLPFSLPPDKSD